MTCPCILQQQIDPECPHHGQEWACAVYRPGAEDMRTTSDCLRACLATITGRPYQEAPDNEGDWRGKAIAFLNASDAHLSNLVIGIGESPRGCKGGHAIVCALDGTPVHDPHPSRAGVVAMWELWDIDGNIAVDQAEFARRKGLMEDHVVEVLERRVDVYGYDGRFLYAGTLQPRQNGGWDVFHHTDSRHAAWTSGAEAG